MELTLDQAKYAMDIGSGRTRLENLEPYSVGNGDSVTNESSNGICVGVPCCSHFNAFFLSISFASIWFDNVR